MMRKVLARFNENNNLIHMYTELIFIESIWQFFFHTSHMSHVLVSPQFLFSSSFYFCIKHQPPEILISECSSHSFDFITTIDHFYSKLNGFWREKEKSKKKSLSASYLLNNKQWYRLALNWRESGHIIHLLLTDL